MQDLDERLLKEFRKQVRDTGSGKFQDPNYPYEVSVEPSKRGHMITVVDIRKRWYGRQLTKHEHPLEDHSPIADNGPAAVAIQILEMIIERKLPI